MDLRCQPAAEPPERVVRRFLLQIHDSAGRCVLWGRFVTCWCALFTLGFIETPSDHPGRVGFRKEPGVELITCSVVTAEAVVAFSAGLPRAE